MNDPRTDEDLVTASQALNRASGSPCTRTVQGSGQAGDLPDRPCLPTGRQAGPDALDILCQRYYQPIYYFIVDQTRIKEHSLIEDIRQEVFLKIFKLIKSRVFKPVGAGSFRAYLFTTAKNICWNHNYHRGREPKSIYGKLLELIPAKTAPDPDEAAEKDARIKARLTRILAKLSPQEIKLMILLNNEGKTYEQIQAMDEFAKYSLDYLMRKAYIIRKKVLKTLKN